MGYIALKDACLINMGQSPESSSYNENADGVPFFQGNADFGEKYPVTRIWCNAPTKIANAGDILISVRAPIGALNYTKEKCCIGRGLAAITPDTSKFSTDFIYWFLKGKNTELNSKGTGSTFKAIGRKVLEETLIPDYGLEQQKRYAANLEKVYAIIQMRKLEMLKLDELIKARFIEMSYEWKCPGKQLSEYLEMITYGFTNPMSDAEDGPWKITAKDVINGYINFNTARKTTQEEFDLLTDKSKPIPGDVLLTKDGTLGRTAIVENDNVCVNQSVAVLRCNEKVIPRFLSILLQLPEYQREMTKNSGGGTIKHIYITKVDKMLVKIPDIKQQKQFIQFLNQVDKSKSATFNTVTKHNSCLAA